MIAFLAAAALAADAPCAQATSISDLRSQITTAFGAFADNDADGFDAASASVEVTARCLGEFLLPADAAELHRFHGLASFYRQEPDYAIQSFQAALILQPGYNLPGSVAPQPGPLWTLYDRARGRPAPDTVPLGLGLGGIAVIVDGKSATARPSLLPYVVQIQGADGGVKSTQYVAAGAAPTLPDGVVATAVVAPPPDAPPVENTKVRVGVEIGFPYSVRLEGHVKGAVLDGVGVRLVVWPVAGHYATGGLAPYLDWHLAGKWQIESGFGAGVTANNRNDNHAGTAVRWFDVAAQYDPPSPFQANFGVAYAGGAAGPAWGEVTAAWLW